MASLRLVHGRRDTKHPPRRTRGGRCLLTCCSNNTDGSCVAQLSPHVRAEPCAYFEQRVSCDVCCKACQSFRVT